MISCRKRSSCSSSSARSVGPGWLPSISKHARGDEPRRRCGAYSLQEFCVLRLAEVLQVAQIGDELWLIEVLLGGEVIEIDGIRKALHKLGAC
jgi:hypothetical protein